MNTATKKIVLMGLLLGCIFTTTHSLAEERFIYQDSEGYCISFRKVEPITLTAHIREWRATLEQQQEALAARIERFKFNTIDTLITVVMPGGLLYAAVKSNNQLQRRQYLSMLTQDIEQLTSDLHSLESASPELHIASIK